jgi:hypothetical protein
MFLFLYQGWVGLTIRKQRRGGGPPISENIRRHRKLGPFLFLFGLIGFCAGLTLVTLDYGGIFQYPLHFIAGLLIAIFLTTAFIISRQIRYNDPLWRTSHFILGLSIISLYIIQIFLGLGILF